MALEPKTTKEDQTPKVADEQNSEVSRNGNSDVKPNGEEPKEASLNGQ